MAEYSKIINGTFTSTGVAKAINLPVSVGMIEIWNLTEWGTNTNHLVKSAIGFSSQAAGTAYTTISNGTANNDVTITSGGFTFFDASTYQYGPTLTITSIVAATGVVTTSTPHNLVVGDAVQLYGTTGELQIAGTATSVTAVGSTTTFTIGNIPTSGFAADASAGFAKKILYPDLYIPFNTPITGVGATVTGVPANNTVINTSVNHSFVVGQEVFFVVPLVTSTVWGATWLDTARYNTSNVVPQQAYVTQTAATNSNLAANQFAVNINGTGQAAFAYPTSAQAALGITFPQVMAIGDQNSGATQIPPVAPPITIPGAFYANTRRGVIIGTGDGTTIMHATNDVIRYRFTFPDLDLTS